MTPTTGLRLAEMAANIPPNMINGTVILEDVYITGFLRERIMGARVEQLTGGWSGYLWNNHLSKCKWLALTKDIFYNEVVMEKNFYVKSYWLWFCNFVEDPILSTLEFLFPHYLLPDVLMKVCHRSQTPEPVPVTEEVDSNSDTSGNDETVCLKHIVHRSSSRKSGRPGARSLGPAYKDGKRIFYEPDKVHLEGRIRQTKSKTPVLEGR